MITQAGWIAITSIITGGAVAIVGIICVFAYKNNRNP